MEQIRRDVGFALFYLVADMEIYDTLKEIDLRSGQKKRNRAKVRIRKYGLPSNLDDRDKRYISIASKKFREITALGNIA